jgi:hypothetical protein
MDIVVESDDYRQKGNVHMGCHFGQDDTKSACGD